LRIPKQFIRKESWISARSLPTEVSVDAAETAAGIWDNQIETLVIGKSR
jgi:hypothetical protein